MKHWNEFINEANDLRNAGKFDDAAATLAEGLAAHPEEMWLHFHSATLTGQRGLLSEAVEQWERFHTSFPTRPDGAAALAGALLRVGALSRAGHVIKSSLDRFGLLPDLLEAKAKLHEHWMEWDAAIYCWSLRREVLNGSISEPKFPDSWPHFRPCTEIKAFGYWNGRDHSLLPSAALWRHVLGEDNYRVVDDDEIDRIIAATRPGFLPIYRSIRIAACKADVARLVYLAEHGGLYMDMHVTLGDAAKLPEIAQMHAQYDTTFFAYERSENREIGNSLIMCKPGAPAITAVLDQVEENLTGHYDKQSSGDASDPYNIFVLSGPVAILKASVDEHPDGTFSGKQDRTNIFVMKIGRDQALLPFYHYSYRKPGSHWSERQKNEPLFDIAAAVDHNPL